MKQFILNFLEKNAKELPNDIAILGDNESLTHLELYHYVTKVVWHLEEIDLHPGINVAIRFKDHIRHFIFYYALLIMEVCQISLNPKEVHRLQKRNISLADIGLVIQDIPLDDTLLPHTLYISKTWTLSSTSLQWSKLKSQNRANQTNTFAEVVIGSGTTGEPKVFYLYASALVCRITREANAMKYQRGERYCTYTAVYYTSAKHESTGALSNQLTVVLPSARPQPIVQFCTKQHIDHLSLTSSQATMLINQIPRLEDCSLFILPNLKSLSLHSSPVSELIRNLILNKISDKLFIKYGTNEVGEYTIADSNDIRQWPGTVGRPFDKTSTVNIVDDNGSPCPVGTIGNILIHTPYPISSYINNQEANQKAFRHGGYCPGDMGRLTEDGNLIFEGRKDDMMIFSGVNIYPIELESVLEAHPEVIESAVFPIRTKTHEAIPFAVVSTKNPVSENDLLKWCDLKLGWRRPQRIFFVNKLPRNKAGKVLKRVLVEKITNIMTKNKAQ